MKIHYCREDGPTVLCGDLRATKGTIKWDDVNCLRCLHIGVKANNSSNTTTGRWSGPTLPPMQTLKPSRSAEEQRRIDKIRLLGWPGYQPQPRRMMAEDICWFGHPDFDALVMMNLGYHRRDFYEEFAKLIYRQGDELMEPDGRFDPLTYKEAMTSDPFSVPQCTCNRLKRPEGLGHWKSCPLYVNPENYHKD